MLWAVLAMFTDYRRATTIAAAIGQLAAVLLAILGVLSGNFILALIALFIFYGAGMESSQAKAKTVLTTRRIDDVQDTMNEYNARLVAVFSADRYLGLVSREDLGEALPVLLFEKRRLKPGTGEA